MFSKWFAIGNKPRKTFEFRCDECGEIHKGSPSFSYEKPLQYFYVPEQERDERIFLDSDRCVIDGDSFFIRGLLEIPISDAEEPFSWGVWVSQSEASYKRYTESFGCDQSGDGSFGWLLITLPGYIQTAEHEPFDTLACNVKWQQQGHRPLIEPQECNHPLYLDFVNGISWERAIELAELVLHGS